MQTHEMSLETGLKRTLARRISDESKIRRSLPEERERGLAISKRGRLAEIKPGMRQPETPK